MNRRMYLPEFLIEGKSYDPLILDSDLVSAGEKNSFINSFDNGSVVFDFVGLVLCSKKLYFFFPKYFKVKYEQLSELSLKKEFEFYFIVVEKFSRFFLNYSFSQNINEFFINDSVLSIYLEILRNFQEHGLYSSEKIHRSESWDDRVNWNRTIESVFPFIKDQNGEEYPFYLSAISSKTISDDSVLITELQKELINIAYQVIGKYLSMFNDPDLTSQDILENYSIDYLISIIRLKLNESFKDDDIRLLRLLIRFLENEWSTHLSDSHLLGFKGFHNAWEKACSFCFNNHKAVYAEVYQPVNWTINGFTFSSKGKLNPDIIIQRGDELYILDAKYYIPTIRNCKISDEPGSESITKQYLYEIILQEKSGIPVTSYFLLPDNNRIFETNEITINLETGDFLEYPDIMGIKPIKVKFLPPKAVFSKFIAG